jgi:hypothetical protein
MDPEMAGDNVLLAFKTTEKERVVSLRTLGSGVGWT